MMLTTAELSHWTRMFFPCQVGPHTAAPMTMSAISFTVIWLSEMGPAHFSMNQRGLANAPQPQPPEGSDVITAAGAAPF